MKVITIPNSNTLGDWAHLAIQQHFQKTIKYERDVIQDKDPEDLHQMRIGMRRLRSAVTGFAPAVNLPEQAREKQIGKIARNLGKLRDLDVLLEAIATRYQPTLNKKDRAILADAVSVLEKKRHDKLKLVRHIFKQEQYESLKKSLKKWLKKPDYNKIAELPIQQVLPDLLLPEATKLFLHPGWLVGVEKQNDSPDNNLAIARTLKPKAVERELTKRGYLLHDLRKQVKRMRYQMSLFVALYGSTYAAFLQDMKKMQEILGDIQDSQVLAEILQSIWGAEISEKLPALAQQLVETRYKSWQQWQTMHQKYFNPETRQAFRVELLEPVSPAKTEDNFAFSSSAQ